MRLTTIIAILMILFSRVSFSQSTETDRGGSACVIAKSHGNSLAIEWVIGEASVSMAIEKAKAALRQQGYEYVFAQANSHAAHGWMVAIQTEFTTFTGRNRTSYGCGFSRRSAEEAEELAVVDLQSYSWGWLAEHGYQVIQRINY